MDRFKDWKEPLFDKEGWAYERIEGEDTFIGRKQMYGKRYGWKCDYVKELEIGDKVDVGCFSYLNAKFGIEIENNVQIGSSCSIYSHNTENNTKGKIIIGESSLIGSHSLILPNTIIPPNSKIPAYSIVVGNKMYKVERKEYALL